MARPFQLPTNDHPEPAKWGAGHTIAVAISALSLDIVSRQTLRNLLPAGETRPLTYSNDPRKIGARVVGVNSAKQVTRFMRAPGPKKKRRNSTNRMSDAFYKALARMEESGWIERGQTHILIKDRRAILDFASSAQMPAHIELDIAEALRDLVATPIDDLSPGLRRHREAELRELKRLMEGGRGFNWSGRGSVRFAPRSSPYLPDEP